MQQFGGTREILCERARIVNRDADLGDAMRTLNLLVPSKNPATMLKQPVRIFISGAPDALYFLPIRGISQSFCRVAHAVGGTRPTEE